MNENELLTYLQGHWSQENGQPNFEIINRNVSVNGSIISFGIPGMDNNSSTSLILKWNAEIEKWQIFILELGWLSTFVDQIAEDYFTIVSYDLDQQIWGEPIRVSRIK